MGRYRPSLSSLRNGSAAHGSVLFWEHASQCLLPTTKELQLLWNSFKPGSKGLAC